MSIQRYIRNNALFDTVLKNKNINVICVHCHFSRNTRNPIIYADIVKELCEIIGNSLVRNSCSYVTRIIDVKTIHSVTYVTVDGTRLHLFPGQGKPLLDYRIHLRKGETVSKQIIVGNTCKESDVILEINNCRRLEVGEVLEFDNLGAYLLNEIPEFLLDYPSVYHKD